MDHLELQPVGIEEEDRVVTGCVMAFPGFTVDLHTPAMRPRPGSVYGAPSGGLKGEMMQSDRIAVIWRSSSFGGSLAKPQDPTPVGSP